MLRLKRIKISNDFKKMLKIHFNNTYEVGGIIFGKKNIFNIYFLETLSFKRGFTSSITFNSKDLQLFEIPNEYIIIGTWHTHPFQVEIQPSDIDLKQWKKWNKDFIHLVFNGEQIKIYTVEGKLIYVGEI